MYFETGSRDEDKYYYPQGIQALGWVFELSPTILTIVYPIWVIHRWNISRDIIVSWFDIDRLNIY